jgi:DNA-binding Lrp family transcriptional regulator
LQKLEDRGILKKSKVKISKRHYGGKVYDIQVSNTNCYQLNGIFSSNSAGGSLVCYLMGIHTLDPMLWGLSFDRFLSPSRGGYMLNVDMPMPIN